MLETSPSKVLMSWYNEVNDLVENDEMKYLKILRAPKSTSARSNSTIIISEEEIFSGNSSEGFQFELSQWYKTWNVSKISRGGEGPEWVFYEGGGMLYSDRKSEELVYVYPDEETCLVGRWDNGEMVEAREDVINKVIFSMFISHFITDVIRFGVAMLVCLC